MALNPFKQQQFKTFGVEGANYLSMSVHAVPISSCAHKPEFAQA